MLGRDDFLNHRDAQIGSHPVPELGGDVGLANFTVDEADAIRTLKDGEIPASVQIVILGACDEKGNRIFSHEDIPALRGALAKIVGPLANAILDHNGIGASAEAAAKNDSGAMPSGDSGSASPSPSDEPSLN